MSDLIQLGIIKPQPQEDAWADMPDRKLTVQMHEFNVRMGKYCYLPIVSGILRAYCETDPVIKEHYEFLPYAYVMESVPAVWARYTKAPDVAAFSVSMWNEQLNLAMAKGLKDTYGDTCLIIFGGYQVPHDPRAYMEQHEFIDVCVTADGEETFLDILRRRVGCPATWDFSGIPGLAYRSRYGKEVHYNEEHRQLAKDLDQYPSPYLSGAFDELLTLRSEDMDWQAIIETTRGCNWPCAFCAWGRGGLWSKYRFHSLERVKAELDWMGRNQIVYCFNADANFGQHPRDQEIAKYVVETKQKYNYPDKFRTCFGKNTDEKIFAIGSLFHQHNLEKGITLARQSNDETTLENINRQNIKLSVYKKLQERFNDSGVPVYSELILGLPGETVTSWKKGIDELLTSGLKNQLFVYLCQVLPNTEMYKPEYQKQHGIRIRRIQLQEIHGSQRDPSWVEEYEDVVMETATMPHRDWREMCKFSWMTMLLHSMKAGFFVMAWLWDRFKIPPSEFIDKVARYQLIGEAPDIIYKELQRWDRLLDNMSVFGEGRGQILASYGNIYWDVEEAALIRMSEDWELFYDTLWLFVDSLLNESDIKPLPGELNDVMDYQARRMPIFENRWKESRYGYEHNVAEYFDKLFSASPVPLIKKPQIMTIKPKDWQGDKERFVRESILWGRKSGTMLVPCEYKDAE